ncbi:MAG: hypothetical protein JNK05_10640 [Myxococcales bacterium]|nr:hypothetical protein [Myxococcales bacterium]
MKRALTALGLATVTLATPAALAQTSVAQSLPPNVRSELARAHFRTGMQYYALNRFGEAAVEFERVYEFTGQSALLYNIARAHDLAGNFARASETYDRYLVSSSADPSSHVDRAEIERLRDRAREQASTSAPADDPQRCVATPTATSNTPIDGATPSTEPATTTTSASTPSTDTRARARARGAARSAAAPALLQLRTQVLYERSAFNEVGPWIAASVGAIAAGFGVWQTTVALGQRAAIERAVAGDPAGWTSSVDRAYGEFSTTSALAWGLTVGGGVALSAGVVWLLARGRGARREVVVAAAPLFNGAVITAGARF